MDSSLGYKNKEIMKLYTEMVSRMISNQICKVNELKARLEVDRLIDCKIVSEDFKRCIVRKYTQRHFTQQKFNLLRDENEGYIQ